MKTIDNELFQHCSSLESVKFEENIQTTLPSSIFYDCPSLKSLTLPAGVTSVTSETFTESSLEYIQLKGETKLDNNMTLPKTLKAICVPESLSASYKEAYSSLGDKIYAVQDTPLELNDASNFDVSTNLGKVCLALSLQVVSMVRLLSQVQEPMNRLVKVMPVKTSVAFGAMTRIKMTKTDGFQKPKATLPWAFF